MESLFQPLHDNNLDLSHRIVLAPLTRNRATEPDLCPYSIHEDYYSQPASPGGLLITEAVTISTEVPISQRSVGIMMCHWSVDGSEGP